MVSRSLPSPRAEENKMKKTEAVRPSHRASKRASNAAAADHHEHLTNGNGIDTRHKRVWKACERCRMRKAKCDGEFPCKRCKDDGHVCAAGIRKKGRYKQLPRGYAEVLENTQLTLSNTIHELYSMVRNSRPWDLGEPGLNGRGQPLVHNIAQKLGCVRPNSVIDLPGHSVFPGNMVDMNELARQLKQQPHEHDEVKDNRDVESATYARADRASSSEVDHFDLEQVYREMAFDNHNIPLLSPQSFANGSDFEYGTTPVAADPSTMFTSQSSSLPNFGTTNWPMHNKTPANPTTVQLTQQPSLPQKLAILNQGMLDNGLGTTKPDYLSCPNSDSMTGMDGLMMYAGYDNDAMHL